MPVPKAQPNGYSQGRSSGLRQPRRRRDLCDTRPCYVNAPVRRASQHFLHRQAPLLGLHRSSPNLSYGSTSDAPPPLAIPVSAPPSLAMTTTTMMYSPPPHVSVPETSSASPILIRRGHTATPYFLHRTPVFQVRSTASMSHITQTELPSTPTRASAPVAAPTNEQVYKRAYVSTYYQSPTTCASLEHLPISDTSPPKHGMITPTTRLSRSRTPTPRMVYIPSPPPPPRKALPPIPFPASPPTLTDADSPLDYFPAPSVSFPPPTAKPSPPRTARPISQDTEETLRQLEQLAASLKQMGTSAASASNSILPTERVCGDHGLSISPVKIGVITFGSSTYAQCTASPTTSDTTRLSSPTLAMPHIMVTNPSIEDLVEQVKTSSAQPVGSSPIWKFPVAGKSIDDDTEESMWVDQYGGWGTSEKGKWKGSFEDEDDDFCEQIQDTPSQAVHSPRTSTESAEKPYIYERVGAPDFLVGSSTSRIARAAPGYRSLPPVRITPLRRRRPAPLVLASPTQVQAEWEVEMALASALFFGAPPKRSKSTRRPQTAPHTTSSRPAPHLHRAREPTMPSSWLGKRSQSREGAKAGAEAPAIPRAAAFGAHPSSEQYRNPGEADRHSEPLPAMPRTPIPTVVHILRGEQTRHTPSASWGPASPSAPSVPTSVPTGTSSEPNSPRPGHVRPRLKSLKGLFKHWSK
ncbi:hypothetical protein C8Q80DRAFT_150246 [Daedaleopsis nitida]|nr:hypothetical protein C8Q80DRAFT_150246 [Daedaleopsis nitida]